MCRVVDPVRNADDDFVAKPYAHHPSSTHRIITIILSVAVDTAS